MRTITPEPGTTIRTVETTAELPALAAWMAERSGEILGIDCETNGQDPFSPWFVLRTAQIADLWDSWVVDATRVDLGRLAALIRQHPAFVAHYAEADIRFLVRGCPGAVRLEQDTPHIADTQTLLAWYDPRTVTSKDDAYGKIPLPKGLKPTVARLRVGSLLPAAEEAMHARFSELAPKGMRRDDDVKRHGFATIPFDDPTYLLYAGLDSIETIRIYHLMSAEVRRRGQWSRPGDPAWGCSGDLSLQWHIDRATLRGLEVDGPYAAWLDAELQRVVDERAPALASIGIGPSGMGGAVGAAFTALGAVSPKTSHKTGAPSWDKDVLKALAKQPDEVGRLAQLVIAVRKAGKFRSTYIAPMLDSLPRDGRIHCSMRAVGTITSRQSAMRPPVQQLPKKDTRVRAAIKAPAGYVLVSCDLSQGEPRTMAALSGDRNLLADILAGDLNSTIAIATFGDLYDPAFGQDADTIHYLMRQSSKAGFLAWCYGAADNTVADTIGVPREQGPTITGRWTRRYPDLARYRNDRNAGRYVELESGWIAPLWDRAFMTEDGQIRDRGKPSRKGLNYATQGNQRMLLARAVHKLVEWGWSWALAMLVHDEILFCVPDFMAHAAKTALEAAMTSVFHGVPIDCHAEILGTTWAKQPAEFDLRELDAVDL